MITPIVLFGIAAVGGLALATLRFKGKEFPMPLSLLHGVIAASGLVTLILYVLNNTVASIVTLALILFVVAALGGFVAFTFHLRKKQLPIPLMLIHAAVAVLAYILLLKGAFWA